MRVQSLSHIWLFETTWTVAHQTLLFMVIFRQEYWIGLPGDRPNPGITPASPKCPLAGRFFSTEPPWKPLCLLLLLSHFSHGVLLCWVAEWLWASISSSKLEVMILPYVSGFLQLQAAENQVIKVNQMKLLISNLQKWQFYVVQANNLS